MSKGKVNENIVANADRVAKVKDKFYELTANDSRTEEHLVSLLAELNEVLKLSKDTKELALSFRANEYTVEETNELIEHIELQEEVALELWDAIQADAIEVRYQDRFIKIRETEEFCKVVDYDEIDRDSKSAENLLGFLASQSDSDAYMYLTLKANINVMKELIIYIDSTLDLDISDSERQEKAVEAFSTFFDVYESVKNVIELKQEAIEDMIENESYYTLDDTIAVNRWLDSYGIKQELEILYDLADDMYGMAQTLMSSLGFLEE